MGNRRRMMASRKKVLFTKRFYPAGTYTWIVPSGCDSVDVFLVGAGGGAGRIYGPGAAGAGGGGYTKTYRGTGYVTPSSGTWEGTATKGRDGNAISVTPGQSIQIIVGAGVANGDGGYSQFMNSSYRAEGGKAATTNHGGAGGSGGGTWIGSSYSDSSVPENCDGGSNGSDGGITSGYGGKGQGHTTRDFGEPTGGINAGGGSHGGYWRKPIPGYSDYEEGRGEGEARPATWNTHWYRQIGGGGYGGGASYLCQDRADKEVPVLTKGGDGTVLIRYYAYE